MTEPDNGTISSVLYVCSMNSTRSPMAEEITKMLYGDKIFSQSAGAKTGEYNGFAVEVMNELGVSMENHVPRAIEELESGYYDLIVTLSEEAHEKTMEIASDQAVTIEYWPTNDPTIVTGNREQILNAHRQVRDGLRKKIKEKLGK